MSVVTPMIGKVLEHTLRQFGFWQPARKGTPNSIAAPGRLGRTARMAVSASLLAPALSGCILGSERPDLSLEVPAAYREAVRTAPNSHVPALDWWRGFRSNELTTLMDAAQIYNLDIAVAIAQIVQADAQVGEAGAPLFPSLTGTSSAEQSQTSSNTAGGGGLGGARFSQYSLGLTASYMVDFWGKNRATLHAAEE